MASCCWLGAAPLYPRQPETDPMAAANSDMRLVMAGAGGRMGRALMHAIAATKGVTSPERPRRQIQP